LSCGKRLSVTLWNVHEKSQKITFLNDFKKFFL
jgi:hypothetical protein